MGVPVASELLASNIRSTRNTALRTYDVLFRQDDRWEAQAYVSAFNAEMP